YPNIHVRMAELIYTLAKSKDEVTKIAILFQNVTDRELVNLYKRLPAAGRTEYSRLILDLLIREFSVRANRLIEANDFYAALKPYKHIEKIIDSTDTERQQLLAYCYARLYFRSADLDLAEEHLQRAIELGPAPGEKILALKALIDKTRVGRTGKA